MINNLENEYQKGTSKSGGYIGKDQTFLENINSEAGIALQHLTVISSGDGVI